MGYGWFYLPSLCIRIGCFWFCFDECVERFRCRQLPIFYSNSELLRESMLDLQKKANLRFLEFSHFHCKDSKDKAETQSKTAVRKHTQALPKYSGVVYLSEVPLQLLGRLNSIHRLGHSCHACQVASWLRGHHSIWHTHHWCLHATHIACRHGHGGNHPRSSWLSYHAYWWGHHASHHTVRRRNSREAGVGCGVCHLSRSHEHCCQENTQRYVREESTLNQFKYSWLLLFT